MRVLIANKFWYRRGGLERVMFDEIAWLEAAGHQVADFSTAHPNNLESIWSEYFVPYLELGESAGLSAGGKALAAVRMFHNGEATRRFGLLLDKFRPDVVHAHGIHRQLSPSILLEARTRGIPVVQTLHDYHHVCPADYLLVGGGEPCSPRQCGVYDYWPCVRNRCVRGSLAASVLSAVETTWQRRRAIYDRCVARFIAPSRFLAAITEAGGWRIPVHVVPNGIRPSQPCGPARKRKGFVVASRLVPIKGVLLAAEAAARAGVDLEIAGDGPLRSQLEGRRGLRLLGHLDRAALEGRISCAVAAVVPSICLENAPMSVLEAMAVGTPVIASALGGIPEQITDSMDGILVAPGDSEALARAMRCLADDPDLVERMGAAARRTVQERFSPERHVEGLLCAYRAAGVRT